MLWHFYDLVTIYSIDAFSVTLSDISMIWPPPHSLDIFDMILSDIYIP